MNSPQSPLSPSENDSFGASDPNMTVEVDISWEVGFICVFWVFFALLGASGNTS